MANERKQKYMEIKSKVKKNLREPHTPHQHFLEVDFQRMEASQDRRSYERRSLTLVHVKVSILAAEGILHRPFEDRHNGW